MIKSPTRSRKAAAPEPLQKPRNVSHTWGKVKTQLHRHLGISQIRNLDLASSRVVRRSIAAKLQYKGSYKYTPLQSVSETRIFKLLPGRRDEPLRVEIEHISLEVPPEKDAEPERAPDIVLQSINDELPHEWGASRTVDGRIMFYNMYSAVSSWDPPNSDHLVSKGIDWTIKPSNEFKLEFEALSYVWGEEEHGEYVQVQEPQGSSHSSRSLYVRPLLAEALRDLRHEDKHRTMWIDAISINQHDLVERNEQVRNMWKIFKYARRTVAWLGTSADDSDVAITHLRNIARQAIVLRDFSKRSSPEATEPKWSYTDFSIPFANSTWEAIYDLLDRPYFERLWVFSELSLARFRAVIVSGKDSIDLVDFYTAVSVIWAKDREPHSGMTWLAAFVQDLISEKAWCPFDDILTSGAVRDCSDMRDKVYGILSLASPALRQLISVDYTATVEQVYRSIFDAILTFYRRLDFLIYCRLSPRAIRGPTWVPDLSSRMRSSIFYGFCSGFSECVTVSPADHRLQILGRKCGIIKSTRDPYDESPWEAPRAWLPSDAHKSLYPTGERRRDAYIATLRVGCLRSRWNDVAEPTFEEWKELIEQHLQDPELLDNLSSGDPWESAWAWEEKRFYTTEEGYYGIGPNSTKAGMESETEIRRKLTLKQTGDVVYSLLGCTDAIVLRPTKDKTFKVVGNCHIYGAGDATAFLGPLPEDWIVQIQMKGQLDFKVRFFNEETEEETVHDPRLGPLPDEWEWVPSERTRDDPLIYEKFRNKVTGEVMKSDPRMLPDALRARGVELEEITLV